MNVSAALSAFRVLYNPALLLSHASVSNFGALPVPLNRAFNNQRVDIRAVVLDKDNCFAKPHENEVYKPYSDTFERLEKAYPPPRLLIVSNSSGTSDDRGGRDAKTLESNTGVHVLRHSTKKPGTHPDILAYFLQRPESGVTCAAHIAVVGDRLFTDVMMANMMGAWSVWVRDGVDVSRKSPFARMETRMADLFVRWGVTPPLPRTPEE